MADAGNIRQGDVVIAPLRPDGGQTKPRPAIVISPDDENSKNPHVDVIGVTGSFWPDDPLYVPLPFHPQGRTATTFTKPCAAKLTWIERFSQANVTRTRGYLAKPALIILLQRLRDLAEKGRPGG